MIALTYALPPIEEMFDSMIAPQDGNLYKSVVSRIYSAPHAFSRISNWKDLYSKMWYSSVILKFELIIKRLNRNLIDFKI